MSSVYEDFRLYFNLEELVVGDEGGQLGEGLPAAAAHPHQQRVPALLTDNPGRIFFFVKH